MQQDKLSQMAKRLKALRKKRGFKSQKQFAIACKLHKFDMDWRRYGAIERGDAKPDIVEVFMICVIMEIRPDEWILGRNPKQIRKLHMLTEREVEMVNKIVDVMVSFSPYD